MFVAIPAGTYKRSKKLLFGFPKPVIYNGKIILGKSKAEIKRVMVQNNLHFDDFIIFDLFDNKGEENYVEI